MNMAKRKLNMTNHNHNIITWEYRKNDHIRGNNTCNHNKAMDNHREMVAVGVAEFIVPEYGEITEDKDGRAYLPYDFLPALVDKLPDEWYYATYSWFKYFDNIQRDATDKRVLAPSGLATVGPDNVEKWK